MREILFRGKRIDNGEWVEGYRCKCYTHEAPHTHDGIMYKTEQGNACFEHFEYATAIIDPSTVGQYTGLTDKNGKRIFEGDVGLLDDMRGVVNYGTGCFCVKLSGRDYLYRDNPAIDIVLNEYPGFEIIGNIHDNPELLKGGTANA